MGDEESGGEPKVRFCFFLFTNEKFKWVVRFIFIFLTRIL